MKFELCTFIPSYKLGGDKAISGNPAKVPGAKYPYFIRTWRNIKNTFGSKDFWKLAPNDAKNPYKGMSNSPYKWEPVNTSSHEAFVSESWVERHYYQPLREAEEREREVFSEDD